MQGTMQPAKSAARTIGRSLVTWSWTRRLVHWIIISAGTMSECVFLIASLWVSVNANVHTFVLKFISEQTAQFLTELATTAYVILPECIVGLAVVVTLGHVRTWIQNKRDYRPAIWAALYGLPTIVFFVLSLVTLGCSVANTTFEMPTWAVVTRAIAGYWFAFVSLLYGQLAGKFEHQVITPAQTVITPDHLDHHVEHPAQIPAQIEHPVEQEVITPAQIEHPTAQAGDYFEHPHLSIVPINADGEPIERVSTVLKNQPDCSDRALAKLSGVAPATAKKYRAILESTELVPTTEGR